MKKKNLIKTIVVFAILCFGCQIDFIDQSLKGVIHDEGFVFRSGCAVNSSVDSDLYEVYLTSMEMLDGSKLWDDDMYRDFYPRIEFLLEKNSSPKTYRLDDDDSNIRPWIIVIALYGKENGNEKGVLFDEGYLEITEINTASNMIYGRITARYIGDDGCKTQIDGNFEAEIEH